MEDIMEVKNLRRVFKGEGTETVALSDATLSIKEGEFVAIMGPSGSGKSTLLHIIGFLDRQTKGTYKFEGKSIRDYTEAELAHVRNKKMGFVFQSFNLLSRTSVLDNVKLPLQYSELPERDWDKRAKEVLDTVGLSHRLDHEPSQLSGGEKQRVAIARALVNNPKVIFADEPTGNLDSRSGKVVMEILQDLNEKFNHTIILITHETYTAEHADRIIKIRDGEVVSDKRTRNKHHAREKFVK